MAVDNVARGMAARAMNDGGGTPGGEDVRSVNGKTGVVVLDADDVGAYSKENTMSKAEIEEIVGNIATILATI